MKRLRLLIVPACLTLAAGMASSIVAMNIAIGILIAVLLAAATPEERARFRWALLPLLPWAGAMFLAYLANADVPLKNLKSLAGWLALPVSAAFLPTAMAHPKGERRILYAFVFALGAASLLALVQHLDGIGLIDTGFCNITFDEYTGRGGQYLCGFKGGTRARGFFYTPMTFGAVLMFGLLAIALLLRRHGASIRKCAAAGALPLLALLTTSTRNAWLGFAAALPVVLGRNKRAWAAACAGALIVFAILLSAPALRVRLLSFGKINTSPNSSTGARLFLWRDAWDQFQINPVFGTGPSTFSKGVVRRHPDVKLLSTKHAHNTYLQILTETGLVGMAGFFISMVWMARRSRDNPSDELRRLGWATMTAFLVSGLFEANFLDGEVIMNFFFWQAISWGALANRKTRPAEDVRPENLTG